MDHPLNIAGSEWVIIVFVALVLILGTNQLPAAARKLGKAVNEYNRAKEDVRNQMREAADHGIPVSGPVENERQKLEAIAKSLGLDAGTESDDELRKMISDKIGRKGADGPGGG